MRSPSSRRRRKGMCGPSSGRWAGESSVVRSRGFHQPRPVNDSRSRSGSASPRSEPGRPRSAHGRVRRKSGAPRRLRVAGRLRRWNGRAAVHARRPMARETGVIRRRDADGAVPHADRARSRQRYAGFGVNRPSRAYYFGAFGVRLASGRLCTQRRLGTASSWPCRRAGEVGSNGRGRGRLRALDPSSYRPA